GISGSALACALASSGIIESKRVALVEFSDVSYLKEWKPSHDHFSNRVSSLTPRSVEFFTDIGVWENVIQERVKPFKDMQVWDGITDARITFNCKDHNTFLTNLGNIAWIAENHNIQQAILTRLSQYKGNNNLTFFENTKVERITFDNYIGGGGISEKFELSDWPSLKLSDGKILKTRLLVGADGINSLVRSFVNIESLGWDYDAHAVVATLHVDPLVENTTAWQRFLPTGPIAMLPMQNGISSMVWSTTPNLSSKIRSLGKREFVHLVNAAFRLRVANLEYFYSQLENDGFNIKDEFEWRHSVESEEAKFTLPPLVLDVQEKSRAGFPLRMRNSESYVKERVALVGDAAHAIHPLAGQGLNQGLADVQCLAKVINHGVITGQDI
ncbi:16314_t:CDS:2, partial [Acaulospora morrowiae]